MAIIQPGLFGHREMTVIVPPRGCPDILKGWQSSSPALADPIGLRWVRRSPKSTLKELDQPRK